MHKSVAINRIELSFFARLHYIQRITLADSYECYNLSKNTEGNRKLTSIKDKLCTVFSKIQVSS